MILSEDEILQTARRLPAIYKITNAVNGKCYVGATNNYRARRTRHFSELRHNRHENSHLQNAFTKYGATQFRIEILTPVTLDEIETMERYFIEWLDATNPQKGYNICKGSGRRPEGKTGHQHTEETRQRIREKKLGQKYSDAARANMSKGQKLLYASGYINPQKGRISPATIASLKKPVRQFNAAGEAVATYGSIKEARATTGWSLWFISKSARKDYKLPDGSYWEFVSK